MREKEREIKVTLIAAAFLLLFGLFYVHVVRYEKTITVTKIGRNSLFTKGRYTVVETKNNGYFIVDTSLLLLNFDEQQEIKRKLKPGNTYEIKYYGFHFPLLRMRRNIIEVIKENGKEMTEEKKIEPIEEKEQGW